VKDTEKLKLPFFNGRIKYYHILSPNFKRPWRCFTVAWAMQLTMSQKQLSSTMTEAPSWCGSQNETCYDVVIANTPPVHPTIEFRACASQPCQHGGMCLDVSHGSFTCQCEPQWTGSQCEDPFVQRGNDLLSENYHVILVDLTNDLLNQLLKTDCLLLKWREYHYRVFKEGFCFLGYNTV
jgi:hypothetical protein